MCDHHIHQHKRQRSISWAHLPSKLILKLSKHLKTKSHIATFRGVCKRWRKHSVPLPLNTLSPVLPLPISTPSPNTLYPPLFSHSKHALKLQVSSIYLITPSKNFPLSFNPWMVFVEESKPGNVRFFHALTGKRVKYCPPILDLTRFRVTELVEGYSLDHSRSVHKVFLCSTSNPLEAMVFYSKGSLAKIKIDKNDDDEEENEECIQWQSFKVRKGGKFWFYYLDDVVSFKGMVYGVDRKGKLYTLDQEKMAVRSIMVSQEVKWGTFMTGRRKRLVVDSKLNKLYLVVREHVQEKARFKVYRLNEVCKSWDMMESLGNDRVLFVGRTHCFFANVGDFPGCNDIGNCIVFVADCFTQYCGRDFPDRVLFDDEDEDAGVYRFGEEDNFSTILMFPEFSQMIWPQPQWFPFCIKREWDEEEEEEVSSPEQTSEMKCSPNTSLPDNHEEGLLSNSSDEDEDENVSEEMQSDSDKSSSQQASSDEDDEVEANTDPSDKQSHTSEEAREADNSKPVSVEKTAKTKCRRSLETDFIEEIIRTPEMEDQVHDIATPQTPADIPRDKVVDSTPVIPSIYESAEQTCSSRAKFQGIEVKSYLLPTLETISAKHGNLIGEDTVHNKSLLACALESLANIVITLQNSTGRTLTDALAEELQSDLADLQRLGLKVNWLVPIVDKALALQKSKPLIESIAALEKAKAEIDEREREFLARSAKRKKELEDSKAYLSATIPFAESIDLEAPLGVGL